MRGWNEIKYIQSLNTFFCVCQLYVFLWLNACVCQCVSLCLRVRTCVSPQLEVFNEC